MPAISPFKLVSAVDSKSGTTARTLYTVPANTQAFVKSVIASNTNVGSSINIKLELKKSSGTVVQLSKPGLSADASTNMLAGTLVMSAGDSLQQTNSSNYLDTGAPTFTAATVQGDVSPSLMDITYGNGLFVAVGSDTAASDSTYNNFVITSPDGLNWTWRDVAPSSTSGYALYTVCFGNGVFVAAGQNGYIFTSTDGINWVQRTNPLGTSTHIMSVAYGNGKFVAVTNGAANVSIITSPDGVNWTTRTGAVATNTSASGVQVCYSQGLSMFAMSTGNTSGSGAIQTSPDGITWTVRNNMTPNGLAVNGVHALNDRFITRGGRFMSLDGVTWSGTGVGSVSEGNIQACHKVVGGKLYAVTGSYLQYTSDGLVWTGQRIVYPSEAVIASDGVNFVVSGIGSPINNMFRVPSLDISNSSAAALTASIIEVAA